ncbi:TPA: TetR family transcriptional regulator C-terminal domain-containing protein [Klebsiella pneumoniae]|nr:TetR family transcriptional regulator C-terminal domain-containing protein [Klebsiella pneumoniae]
MGISEPSIAAEFVANAYVGVVEWWLKNEMPSPPRVMAEKAGVLLERNL